MTKSLPTAAAAVTLSNEKDGFAAAVEQLIIPRVAAPR
jgi:hypothetical protein